MDLSEYFKKSIYRIQSDISLTKKEIDSLSFIEEKLKNAPDDGYQIGVVIGTYLPFVVLVGIAYFVYYKAKNRKDLED